MSDGDVPAPVVAKQEEVPKSEPKAESSVKPIEEEKPAAPSRPKSRRFVRVRVADDDDEPEYSDPGPSEPRQKREKSDDDDGEISMGGLALMGAAIFAFLSMK